MIEMGKAEQNRSGDERADFTKVGFKQILQNCAEEHFFRQGDQKESEPNGT